MGTVKAWVADNYAEAMASMQNSLRVAYVVFSFCAAFFLGGIKAMVVGPVAAALMILGNVGVILVLFPAHVWWTIYSLIKTDRINAGLKLAGLIALPVLLGLWLGLGIFGSALVALGYGFFTPWISTFEAFRQESDAKKFVHGIVDGTWGTIKGSCTVVRDFADICFHSYPVYLKEFRQCSHNRQPHSIRLLDVPSCIAVGLLGLAVDIPLYTVIALVKSPYMLFKGWQRLLHDLISREGPFLETVCVPIAGLAILFWPLVVVGSVLMAVVSSIFVGLYGAVIVYQEKSFRRGISYVVTMVAEFDEYTNDWLYLREGTVLPKPSYRKRKLPDSAEFSLRATVSVKGGEHPAASGEAPAMLVPALVPARSVREAIQEVKMVQIWENIMKSCELRGRDLLNLNVITTVDLTEWLRTKDGNNDTIDLGLPSYALLCTVLQSIKAGSGGLLLGNGVEVDQQNRPQDLLLDWFFHPVLVLKDQIQVLKMREEEVRFLEKSTLFVGNFASANAWDNGAEIPKDPVRTAQIQAISRRMVGIVRSMSKFPTYRRRYRHVVKLLVAYSVEREGSFGSSDSAQSISFEITRLDV
ncbi:uncharacterized membrane protein At3g27390 [Brachypodium distachyon]|uniref:Uncharacterized protein n=1 Tax=Brachypodium distachyon TaxID=15368 RepID=I1IY99_BRADI|nr:uncharacterized membrane protein At3g27390 [Brachypodium distachyon]KQJ82880.1 hypothetical protein BRADI_5g11790v3 [Brachypodium distachyon]|eukprot:XP_003579862.1 uncharacterized membrane protein At3g27390 [Brachypodium distachyon]